MIRFLRIAGLLVGLALLPQPSAAAADGTAARIARVEGDARSALRGKTLYVAARARKMQPGANWSPRARAAWRQAGMNRLRAQMSRARPAAIRILGRRIATAHLRFTVLSDGRVTNVGLARSSGLGAIDRLALNTLRSVRRMPAPGPHRRVNITVPLQFVGSGRP